MSQNLMCGKAESPLYGGQVAVSCSVYTGSGCHRTSCVIRQRALATVAKWPCRATDNLLSSSAEVKSVWSYNSIPTHPQGVTPN
jgi:hypothetical protein